MSFVKVASMNPIENSNEKFGNFHVQLRYTVQPLQSVRMVVSTRRFGATYRPHFRRSVRVTEQY